MIRHALLLLLIAAPAWSAGTPDPDWPCVQRRQPALSLGQVWSGPAPGAAAEELAKTDAVQDVARVIALRRTDLAAAETMIADFAASHDADAQVALFLAAFDHIQTQRNRVMEGITRYAHKQEQLDSHIEEVRHQYDALMAAQNKDFDALDKLEQDIDWSTRIFQDRQQSLTYVCETPVILEQRAFALGRAVAAHLPK
ncbi:MAG: hypothetical protein QM656_09265 [Paracoccaceae bacterium]